MFFNAHLLNESYEVKFSREDGVTIAWFAVQQNEVKPYEEPNKISGCLAQRLLSSDAAGRA